LLPTVPRAVRDKITGLRKRPVVCSVKIPLPLLERNSKATGRPDLHNEKLMYLNRTAEFHGMILDLSPDFWCNSANFAQIFCMAFQSFLQLFAPKDRVFYSLFEQVADGVARMGKLMKEVVAEPDFDKRAAIASQVEDQEHVNDDLTHQIFTELGRNFITPFDREDIHYLASALDDICDYIFSTTKKINFYKVNPNDMGIQKLADLIEQGACHIHTAVKELRNMRDMRKITDALVKVNSIENQADDIFDLSIERLFETEPDAKEVIKKREIYQVMEIVTDKCEDAANVIESIIIKYA
jgi:uncharacterized protein Yka (UPF0111/DUF47 family)